MTQRNYGKMALASLLLCSIFIDIQEIKCLYPEDYEICSCCLHGENKSKFSTSQKTIRSYQGLV